MPPDTLRQLENDSIRAFVASCHKELRGKVLDYGCGASPHRDLVRGARYYGYDDPTHPAYVFGGNPNTPEPWWQRWDAILCTQVLEYIPDPASQLREFNPMLRPKGHLVLTYPTNWPEVEKEDLHRFTQAGMERLLHQAHFEILRHERRAEVRMNGNVFALGYGVVARPWIG